MTEKHTSDIAYTITDKYFLKFKRSQYLFLLLSRLPYLKQNGAFLFFLQKVMTISLSKLHRAIEDGNTFCKSVADESTKKRITTHKHISRIIQTIADGIAWRVIGFNRPLMRLLSDKPSPGHIDSKELKNILSIPRHKGEVFIINDLTRFCRIGDFTVITKDYKIFLYEMKSRKDKLIRLLDVHDIFEKLKKNNRIQPTKQDLRQLIAQNAIITNQINIPTFDENQKLVNELKVNIQNINVDIPNIFPFLKKLIRKAKRTSFAASEVEDGLFVEVWDFKRMLRLSLEQGGKNDPIEKIKEIRTPLVPAWFNESKVIPYDTSIALIEENNQFPRNIIPYSVLPFSTSTCLKIMTGEIEIRIFYYLPTLRRQLETQGWVVTETEWETEINSQGKNDPNLLIFNYGINSAIFKVEKHLSDGTFYSEILFTELLQIISSFYSPSLILKSLEARLKDREQIKGSVLVASNYTKEKNILK